MGLHQLLKAVLLRSRGAGAHHGLRGEKGAHLDGQIDPDQHLAGVEDPGIRALDPGQGGHGAGPGHPVCGGGAEEGQVDFHAVHPASVVRLVEHRAAHGAGQLQASLLGLLALETDGAGGIGQLQNIRAGVRDDHLHGLLVEQGGLQDGFKAGHWVAVEFKFHSIPLLVQAFLPIHARELYAPRRSDMSPQAKKGPKDAAQGLG